MTVVVIIFGTFVLSLYSLSTFLRRPRESRDNIMFPYAWGTMIMICFVILSINMGIGGTYKEGQKDALNGIYKYERQFVIPEGDSIVVDTLYIEINQPK